MPFEIASEMLLGLVTSRDVTSNLSPSSKSRALGERIVAITFQPWSRNSAAEALPKPEEQPVIRTAFLISYVFFLSRFFNFPTEQTRPVQEQ